MIDATTLTKLQTKTLQPLVQAYFNVDLDEMITHINASAKFKERAEVAESLVTALKAKIAVMDNVQQPLAIVTSVKTGDLPQGNIMAINVHSIFPELHNMADFFVDSWVWEADHPDVPIIDPNYIFDSAALKTFLMARKIKSTAWLHGHTGTGKSTFVEQVCARLKIPMLMINFDSDISRVDLVGKDVLSDSNGVTISKFDEGILIKALSHPYMILLDEMDFIREDVAYVFQSLLNDGKFTLLEDGGRRLQFHSHNMVVATANTQGRGDYTGLYRGAKIQSAAFLDRFNIWIDFKYPSKDKIKLILGEKYIKAPTEMIDLVSSYAIEHWVAFNDASIRKPLSIRGLSAWIELALCLIGEDFSLSELLRDCFVPVIGSSASEDDKVVLSGLIEKVIP